MSFINMRVLNEGFKCEGCKYEVLSPCPGPLMSETLSAPPVGRVPELRE